MSYQERMNDESNCKFRVYHSDPDIGGNAIVQRGRLQFDVELIDRDCMVLFIHPNAAFTKMSNWRNRLKIEINKWLKSQESRKKFDPKYDFPTDIKVDIIDPSAVYRYMIGVQ